MEDQKLKDIIDIFQTLKTAYVPSILIIFGAAFLLLAFVGKIGTLIVLSDKRQKWAAILGGALLLLGVCLFLIPSPKPTLTAISTANSPAQDEMRNEKNEIRDKQEELGVLAKTIDVLMGKVDKYEEQVTGQQSRIILYEHIDYKGHGCYVRPADNASDLRLYGCGNSVSSIKVEGNIRGRAYTGTNYSPSPPLQIDHNMPFLDYYWNDRILSVVVEQRE
jgi:hypothetical protein